MTQNLMSVQELSNYLNVDISWIYERTSKKTMPFIKVGKYVRFSKEQIDQWLESQTVSV